MTSLVHTSRYRRGRILWPQPGGAPNADFGPRWNDWVVNPVTCLPRTTGPGGDFPTGKAYMPGRAMYCDPVNLTQANRVADATKPNNNWVIAVEYDGPGTVTFDLRPESAASALGQTQTQAYNDTAHGGALRATGTGSFKWIFDGLFAFQNGAVFLTTGQKDLIFHGGSHFFSPTEWRRQFDIIRAILGVADSGAGATIPDNDTYRAVWFSDKWHGNNFPNALRLEGASNIHVIRNDLGPCTDDAVFTGNGSNDVSVIGSVIHEVDNASNGPGPEAWFHNDGWQATGANQRLKYLDCTVHGHWMEWVAEVGSMTNCIADRLWVGGSGAAGGDLGTSGGGGGAPRLAANPNATVDTNAVLAYITDLKNRSTRKFLSGQFLNFQPGSFNQVDAIQTETGKRIALVGVDYAFTSGFSAQNALAIQHWNAGGLVTISYHMPNPMTGGAHDDRSVLAGTAMLTNGTAARTAWIARMDAIAAGFQALEDAGVVVIYRPFHEMDEPFFWWGQVDPTTVFIPLWRDLFNYLTYTKGLNNILWNWGGADAAWYPGSAYVDMVGCDIYNYGSHINGSSPAEGALENIKGLGKPFALNEYGTLDDDPYNWPDLLAFVKNRYPNMYGVTMWINNTHFNVDTGRTAFLNDSWVANLSDVDYASYRSSGGLSMDSTNKIGSGAPATSRPTGHFVKTFSMGTDHNDGDPQNGYAIFDAGANWHTGLIGYAAASFNPSVSNMSVAVPSGVTVNGAGFMTSALSTFLNSSAVPHKVFQAAYGADELLTVLADYGISL